METKNEKKKGFWASLFSPKPCSCSCGSNLIVEEDEKPAAPNFENIKFDAPRAAIREIKILGPGCAKCKATYQVITKVIDENKLDVKLTKIRTKEPFSRLLFCGSLDAKQSKTAVYQ